MILEKVERFYEELAKEQGLTKRKGQKIGSAFFSLPLYGEVTTIVGEGQTGMGKTISYLTPIAMHRLGMLPEVPSFVMKHEDNLFLEKGSLEDVVVNHDLVEDVDVVLKGMRKPVLGKTYVLTATKMLQNQIIDKDLKTMNEFLQKKGAEPINHAVLMGKKNYVCLGSVKGVVDFLEKLERVLADKKAKLEREWGDAETGKVIINDVNDRIAVVRELREKLLKVIEEKSGTFDDFLKIFKKKEREELFEKLEDVFEWEESSEILPAGFASKLKRGQGVVDVLSPSFSLGSFFYKNLNVFVSAYGDEVIDERKFINVLMNAYRSIVRNGAPDELFSVNYFSECRSCPEGFRRHCEFYQNVESLSNADVLIMNYYYFASVYAVMLGSLQRTIRQFEQKLGMPVSRWGEKSLAKALEPYEHLINAYKDFSVEKAVETLTWYKKVYEKYYKNALFVFDEAHVFERDVLMSRVRSVDLKEMEKRAKKLREKLAEVYNVIDLPLLQSTGATGWEKRFAALVEESYKNVAVFHTILKNSIDRTKEHFKDEDESVSGDVFLFFVTKTLVETADEMKGGVYGQLLEDAVDFVSSELARISTGMAYSGRKKVKERELTEVEKNVKASFKERLKEELERIRDAKNYGELPVSARIASVLVALAAQSKLNVFDTLRSELPDLSVQVKKDEPALMISKVAWNKFPGRRLCSFGANYFHPLREMLANGAFGKIMDELNKQTLIKGSSSLQEKDWGFLRACWEVDPKRFKSLDKKNEFALEVLKRCASNRGVNCNRVVFFDGLTVNEMSDSVEEFLRRNFPDWINLRKVFTSATLASGYSEGRPDFNFFLRSVGIRSSRDREKTKGFVVTSPFDYRKNSLFYLPEDIPPLREGGKGVSDAWKSYVAEKLKESIFYAKGGVLILSTSNEMVYFLKERLKDFFEENDVEVFVQGHTPLREIQRRFGKVDPDNVKQVLIAGPLFWQGFDVPGEGLTHVVLLKLPFFEPNNPYNVMVTKREYNNLLKFYVEKRGLPLEKAHRLADGFVFKKIIMPAAVLQFRQGVGRLIRTETDRGLVTCFDDRLVSRKYGEQFAKMLAMPFTRKKEEVFKFLERAGILGVEREERATGKVRMRPALAM